MNNKKQQPFISFIVPAYNSSDTLPRLFTSLLAQSSLNYEVIVVDDGSTDETLSLCNAFIGLFNGKLKTIHLENGGPLYARLNGIIYSKGLYLAFLDSDDYIDSKYVEMIEKHYCSLPKSPNIFVIDMIKVFAESKKEIIHTLPSQEGYLSWEQYGAFLSNGLLGYSSLKIYQKSIFKRINKIDKNLLGMKLGEDLLLSIGLFSKDDLVFYTKKPVYYYVCKKGSLSSTFTLKRAIDYCQLLDEKVMFMKNALAYLNKDVVDVITPSILVFLKDINKIKKHDRKEALSLFYSSYTFVELFKSKKNLTKIVSLKDRIIICLIRLKYCFK